jgi:hypothetical protein
MEDNRVLVIANNMWEVHGGLTWIAIGLSKAFGN